MSNCIMLVGIPGSGKSTWAKNFFYTHYAIVSSDEIRKRLAGSLRDAHDNKIDPWDEFYRQIEDRLRLNVDVIADATFLTKKHRDRLREVVDKTNADLHAVVFKNWAQGEVRNAARDEDTRVPAKAMEGMVTLFWDTMSCLIQERYATVTKIDHFA